MEEKIHINGNPISVKSVNEQDYISLTDMVKVEREESKPADIVRNWLTSPDTTLLLEEWEKTFNPDFKVALWHDFRNYVYERRKYLTIKKYIEMTQPIGLVSSSGRYGGTYAHVDIAFEFGTWLSPKFKIALIRDYRRLKSAEYQQHKLEWNETRFLSKINAGILSESIKENLLPKDQKKGRPFATAFDMVNLAVFDMTAKEWRARNPEAKGNIRDTATTVELILISNLESLNAVYIDAGASYEARLIQLYEVATKQRKILEADKRLNAEKKFLE